MAHTHGAISDELKSAISANDVAKVRQLTQTATTSMLQAAGEANAVDVTNYLLDVGGKVVDCVLESVAHGEAWDVHRTMIERSAVDVNEYIPYRGDMLGVAIRRGSAEHVKYLLSKGADPLKHRSAGGTYTNLASAARTGRTDIVEMLLPYRWDKGGALVAAAETNQLDVAKLLINRGFDVNEIGIIIPHRDLDHTGTPLHKAIEQGNVEMAKLLLDAKAKTNIKDGQGRTAKELAKGKGKEELAALL